MSTLTSRLVVELLDRLTGPARGVTASINRLTAASQANAAKMAALRGKMFDAAGAGFLLYKGIAAPVKAAMEFESAMADVRKVVDFPTPDAFKKMGADIRALSRDMPMAADGIAQIVAAAGQSGIANADLLEFAKMATKVSVAWDTSAAETGDALAKLKTALGLSIADTGSLADAINHLGNKSAASAPDILDVVKRVAPMASQFGLTAEQAAAFGAAMVGSGFQSEVASTSFLNMGRALTKGASATKRQQAAFGQLGLSSKRVAKAMQKDAAGTIQDVLARIRKVPAAMRASVISDLFGDEAKALGPLITNADLLADTLGLVADKTRYAGSAQAEYDERSKTTENAMQLFKNRINDLGISIGDALIPGLNALIDRIGPIVTSVSELAQRFPMVTNAIVGVTAAVVGFRVASIGAQYAGLFLKGAFLDAGIAALTVSRSIGRIALAPVVAGFNALRTAMIGYTAAAAAGGHGAALSAMGQSLMGLLNPARLVTGAFRLMKVALISTGIGAIAVGIAAAGVWIYKNWTGISTAFEAFKGAFTRAIAPIMPAIQPIIDIFSGLWETVSNLLGPIDEMGGGWTRAGLAAGKFVGETVAAIIQLPGKIGEALAAGWQAVVGWFSSAVESVSGFLSSIGSLLSGGEGDWKNFGQMIGEAVGGAIRGLIDLAPKAFDALVTAALSGTTRTIEALRKLGADIIAILASIDLSSIGKQIMESLLAGLKAAGTAILDYARNIGSSIKGAISGAASGFYSGIKSGLGLGAETPAVAGARAVGGPVRAGLPYLVGERGPELVTFPQAGFVHDALKTVKIMRNAALASAVALPAAALPALASPSPASAITIALKMPAAPTLQVPKLTDIAVDMPDWPQPPTPKIPPWSQPPAVSMPDWPQPPKLDAPELPAATAPAAAQARQAPNVNVGGVTIHVQAAPGQSSEQIADAVARQFSARLSALSRGAFSDGAN